MRETSLPGTVDDIEAVTKIGGQPMGCYPCTHCNKCGIFSVKAESRCAQCGALRMPGTAACKECGCKKTVSRVVSDEKPKP